MPSNCVYQFQKRWTRTLQCAPIILCAAISFSGVASATSPTATSEDIASREVIILVDRLQVAAVPYTAETIVADFQSTQPSATLRAALSEPVGARFSLSDRLPQAYRAGLRDDDPEEIMQRYVVLTYSSAKSADAALTSIKGNLALRWAGKNTVGQWSMAPNDTYYPYSAAGPLNYQWGPDNVLGLQAAWDRVKGSAYVAHVDNGIMLGHGELDDSYFPWNTPFRNHLSRDFVAASSYASLFTNLNGVDEGLLKNTDGVGTFAGHGTHTAGIIAAASNNAYGVAGVCWNCSLIVTKIYPDVVQFQNAVYWAVRAGAQVLNFSGHFGTPEDAWGNRGCAADPNNVVCQALEFARGRDVVVVASSGNLGQAAIDWPAMDARTIAVGGIQSTGAFNGYALWNEENPIPNVIVGSNYGPEQKFVAPARDVLSTVYSNREWNPSARCGDSTTYGSNAGVGFGICTGTSMSAPFVTRHRRADTVHQSVVEQGHGL